MTEKAWIENYLRTIACEFAVDACADPYTQEVSFFDTLFLLPFGSDDNCVV